MKLTKLFLILSIVMIAIGGAMFVAGAILSFSNNSLGDLLMGLSGIFGFLALGLLIYRLVMMSKDPEVIKKQQPKVVVKIVDVKDLPKTKEQELYDQYEDLYKRNLITKEELDQKRKDLLGK